MSTIILRVFYSNTLSRGICTKERAKRRGLVHAPSSVPCTAQRDTMRISGPRSRTGGCYVYLLSRYPAGGISGLRACSHHSDSLREVVSKYPGRKSQGATAHFAPNTLSCAAVKAAPGRAALYSSRGMSSQRSMYGGIKFVWAINVPATGPKKGNPRTHPCLKQTRKEGTL